MFGHKVKGPAGHVIITEPGSDPKEFETRQCVHCGKHWIYRPGSGTKRGFCLKCMGVTCGAEACDACVPYEARVELAEGAKPGAPGRKYAEENNRITIVGG